MRDESQLLAADALDDLLLRVGNGPPKKKLFVKRKPAPIGLYMWGGVGRGKSMLMDMFFDFACVRAKRRVHFHAFMLDVHRRITIWRKLDDAARKASPDFVKGAGDDPIAPVAKAIARDAMLLCFDEFHVTDITDAMIISRLFEALFARGVCVLATSNRHPDTLYENGLNRHLFLPFLDILKDNMEVFEFPGDVDHRLRQLSAAPVFYAPLGAQSDAGVERAWKRIIGAAKPQRTILSVQGRELVFDRTAACAVRTDFDSLCNRPLGSADYLRVARSFQTLVLENVPLLHPENRNEAKRFVTLIDALYETRTKLIMSAAAEPEELYPEGDGSFEFQRTASRLVEMRSTDYLAAPRILEDGETGSEEGETVS